MATIIKSFIKSLIPTRWRLRVRRFHRELWTPELIKEEGWYEPHYRFPRQTFFPRKENTPQGHTMSSYERDYDGHTMWEKYPDGTVHATPYAVLKEVLGLNAYVVATILVIAAFAIPVTIVVGARAKQGFETCGGYLEAEQITASCAEERGMTIEEYNQWRKQD